MGGPIDTRRSPTAVNKVAQERGVDWFRRNCIVKVPASYPGFWRDVYPGFLQLSGFMAMNMDRHLTAHYDMFKHLVRGDGDSAEKHREFYDEYLAVMDLTAEYYLQTVEKVFVDHELPNGTMMHRDKPIDLKAIRRCAIMAIEGEKDDISGVGQTLAALQLTPNLAVEKKVTISSSMSAITASSTAPASAPRRRRGSPISSSTRRWASTPAGGRRRACARSWASRSSLAGRG